MDQHDHADGAVDMMTPHQKHLGPHMRWTELRTANADDAKRAGQIVQTLRQTLAKYKDYWAARDGGYVPLHPERTPKHYHFANKQRRFLAKIRFDPAEPTALLYKKAGDGYELEGAMYTAPRGMSEDQLNERVPLSVAQWHAHINICFTPRWQWTPHDPETTWGQGDGCHGIRVSASRRVDDSCVPLRIDSRKDLDPLRATDWSQYES